MNKLICFDVDGTLTENRNSWLILTAGLGVPDDKVVEIYEKTENGAMSISDGVKRVVELFRATGRANKEYIYNLLSNIDLKPDAIEISRYLKEKGYFIFLLSGAIDVRVRTVAEKVGADGFHTHATLIFNEAGALADIYYDGRQRSMKERVLRGLSAEYQIPLNEIIFVGDNDNDAAAFRITGHGIAVQPYHEILEKVAWKTVKSLSEIKDILK